MSFKSNLLATLAAMTLAVPVLADGTISVDDAYARSSGKTAKAGAAFMMIQNQSDTDDRLIGVTSDAAARVELHTHKVDDNGVAKMVHVEEGFVIPAGETHMLKRGGDHVMFMGLTAPFEQDATVPVTLIFENAGEVEIEIPVDLERQDKGGHGSHDHGSHSD
ncbi:MULTISPECIES: copper chaperone PCu(A)C [unclassified Ruegeria]|uniref:copper chaperone PCu(A)C n=1 Tax=unclassified Ruegeria TaxID=2625375 RepID=UPI0014889B98|nr:MULTISPECIES: copper chaperone PCu(A)C [unclassified Ruegeria]NOD62676.1 copper chaperone PCu(A)C [Ruegeria sp. HKCCD6109]